MGTQIFLKFFVNHLETIILGSAFAVVLLIIVLVLFGLKEPTPQAAAPEGKLNELEGLLRKMLDSAALPRITIPPPSLVTEGEPAGASATPVVKQVDMTAVNEAKAEVAVLKTSLSEKEALIAKLKSSLELAQSDAAKKNTPVQQMQDKIKELEAKLAEYEIIEDDIADLTMYKEENAQLKNQIKELMKNQGISAPPAAAAPAAAAPEPAAAPAAPAPEPVAAAPQPAPQPEPQASAPAPAVEDDVLEEFKKAVGDQKAAAAVPETATASTPAPSPTPAEAPKPDAVDDDLMAEFAAALNEQKANPKKFEEPKLAIVPSAIPKDLEGPVTQDIMEEFVTAVNSDDEVAAAPAVEPNHVLNEATDTDKMLEEMQNLKESTQDGQANLDVDTDKMLSEVSELDKASGNQKS